MACAGFSARQRKLELERLNEQLRKINLNLRQQARAGTVYAPGLMYAPTPTPNPMSGISVGSEDDGGKQGGAATLTGPRPESPEDSQVGSYSSNLSHLTFLALIAALPCHCFICCKASCPCMCYWTYVVIAKLAVPAKNYYSCPQLALLCTCCSAA